MSVVAAIGYFLAGTWTLVSGIPAMAADGKMPDTEAFARLSNLGRVPRVLLNFVALLPGVYVTATHGIFSWPTLLVLAGIALGSLPIVVVLSFLAQRQPAT